MNWVISFGKYTGGRVWIARKGGSEPPPGLPNSPRRGEYFSTHNQWLHFDPRQEHAVEPVMGWRVSLVFFTPSRLHALTTAHWQELQRYGFPCSKLCQSQAWMEAVHLCQDEWYRDLEDM
eukprot:1552062-Amphidinium_carterae.1